ncbi:Fe-S cluster assembly protein dre2 [Lepidopterella palustris CBS 459.81]|uniref:Fe-S cluster assembly protein dre2 n=1 Tax=Lepidopterella palustris CBS 459.81 TaxID=1314670 RepID=A0A8E2EBB8_9PEZI|nr:Fe-S cluster assembly protein dre2 [Lepidopterella palustris CBS 459.81]
MTPRTLLLAPPSVSAHPEVLEKVYEAHHRESTDIHMLDRLALGLVNLPPSTYDVVLLLTDADGTSREGHKLLGREVMTKVVYALKPGGILRSQDGLFGSVDSTEKTEAILAGLVNQAKDGMIKPDSTEAQSVPLRFGKKTNGTANGTDGATNGTIPVALNGKRKETSPEPTKVAGVGFVDFSNDFDDPIITGEDDELVDEDDLITEEDMARPIVQPPECRPKAGKRRRACKDCTCGLKEKIEAEDAEKRSTADKALNTMKLGADDLAEVDFTVQGKVGSCGNCALGDAFRCDGCPYIGLPAFKPGEEVRLLNNDIQL